MKLKAQAGVQVRPPTGQPLPEERTYHGYTTNGKPIPKRTSLPTQQQRSDVPPTSPHRAGHHPELHDESQPFITTDRPARNAHAYDVDTSIPTRNMYQTLSSDELFKEGDDDEYSTRLPTSSLRYDMPEGRYTQGNTWVHVRYGAPPPRPAPTTQRQGNTGRDERVRESRREQGGVHWLVVFGLSMLVTLVLWVLGSLALSLVHAKWDEMTYGYPRTFQIDAVVGHNNDSPERPSHFIALNLNRRVEIIELPAGDPTRARVYVVLTLLGDGQELTPVTLSFRDVTGDGKPDMLIHIQGQIVVYLNENGQFRPQRPGEQINM